MFQCVCNICRKVLKGNPPVHYCERCIPFAPQYEETIAQLNAELAQVMERRTEQAHNEFIQRVVVPGTKTTLKAV